jgi:hypothetical protein
LNIIEMSFQQRRGVRSFLALFHVQSPLSGLASVRHGQRMISGVGETFKDLCNFVKVVRGRRRMVLRKSMNSPKNRITQVALF